MAIQLNYATEGAECTHDTCDAAMMGSAQEDIVEKESLWEGETILILLCVYGFTLHACLKMGTLLPGH